MSTFNAIPFALSAIAIVIAVLGAIYLRKHPQVVAQLDAALKSEFDKLHLAFDAVNNRLHDIHNATQAPVTVALVPAQPPADFGPLSPTGAPVPPSAPAGPPAPAAPPVAPPGGNTTDPTAPGFVMPANVAPAPAPVAPEDDDTQRPDVLDKDTYQGRNTTFVGTKTITGTGQVNVRTGATVKLGGTQSPVTVTVNGHTQSSVIAQTPFSFVGVDLPATVTASTPVVMVFNG